MSEKIDSGWNQLFKITAWGIILSAVTIPISMVVFFIWPPFPADIFAVIQGSKLAGVMSLDFMYVLGNAFALTLFPALYLALKGQNKSWALIALVLGLVALIALIPARPIVEMLQLSARYAAATSDAQRTIYQAAGEATLALFTGTAYYVHYILGTISLLISSILMLRSPFFSKAAAYVGIVSNVSAFGLLIPGIGVYISLVSVVGLLVWWLMLARVFLWLGSTRAA